MDQYSHDKDKAISKGFLGLLKKIGYMNITKFILFVLSRMTVTGPFGDILVERYIAEMVVLYVDIVYIEHRP